MMRWRNEERVPALARVRQPGIRLWAYPVFAFLGLFVLAACGGGSDSPSPTPTTDSGGSTPAASVLNLEVPDFTISAYQGADVLGGEEVTLSELVGHGKPVVLNFWAALCPPCRAEMPDIQRIHDARGHEVTVVGIDIGPQQFLGSRQDGRDLLAELDVSYPAGTTFEDTVVRDFRIVGMPTTFFIYPDGRVLRTWSGLLNEEKINEFIDELLEG
jgi:thiol-disulfide isomerase/thioredoxin